MPHEFTSGDLTAQRLREVISYDSITGVFIRIHCRRTDFIGAEAGHIGKLQGYRFIRIDGYLYKASRLAWLYCYGEWPREMIDHIDGNRVNDRIGNLREATSQQNNSNKRFSGSAAGYKGVYRTKHNRYVARLVFKRRCVRLGSFDDPSHAAAAYNIGASTLFGEFASLNKL
jgi:hypothetical protein